MSSTTVLFFADIFGRPGRRALAHALPDLRSTYRPDFIVGNVENLAGGRGVNKRTLNELLELGFHGFTTGNHVWDNKEVYGLLENESRLLRPENWPNPPSDPCPGKGHVVLRNADRSLLVVNLMGRVFMETTDCPFQAVDRVLSENSGEHPVLVDMHAEASSEKYAMGWYLAGRVAAVVGSHSHVQTADERILPGGTAFITDVGLTGAFDSVIGLRPHEVIKRFITKRPHPYQGAKENPGVCCVVIRIGADRKAESIERLRFPVAAAGMDDKDLE